VVKIQPMALQKARQALLFLKKEARKFFNSMGAISGNTP